MHLRKNGLAEEGEMLALTSRHHFDRFLVLHQKITSLLMATAKNEAAFQKVIQEIAEFLGMDAGALWIFSGQSEAVRWVARWRRPSLVDGPDSPNWKVGWFIPISSGEGSDGAHGFGRVFGYLEFLGLDEKEEVEGDSESALRSLKIFSNQIAQYLMHAQLEASLREQEERRQFISEASSLLLATIESREPLQKVAELTVSRFTDGCLIELWEGEGKKETVAFAARHPKSEDLSRWVVPIKTRDKKLGEITFWSHQVANSLRSDQATAEDLSHRIALALENLRLFEAAQRAIRLRDDFIMVASHELKTPLTPLILQVETLLHLAKKGMLDSFSKEKLVQMLRTADRQILKLSHLIDFMLEMSQLRAGKLDLEIGPFELIAEVKSLLDEMCEEFQSMGCAVQLASSAQSLEMNGDRRRLREVLRHLLGNAMRYGGGKPIEVKLESMEGGTRIAVIDHGIGIAPENHERIFESFERGSSIRHFGGFGLGLYLVKEIVQAHRGKVSVKSQPGEITTFLLELPLDPGSEHSRSVA